MGGWMGHGRTGAVTEIGREIDHSSPEPLAARPATHTYPEHTVLCCARCAALCCAGMFAPGIIGFVVGAFILLAVKDTPQSAGYLPVEVGGGGGGGVQRAGGRALGQLILHMYLSLLLCAHALMGSVVCIHG